MSDFIVETIFPGELAEARVTFMDVGILVGVGCGGQINNEVFLTDEVLNKIVELRKLHSAKSLGMD